MALDEMNAVFPPLFFPRVDSSCGGVEGIFSDCTDNQIEPFLGLPYAWIMKRCQIFHCTLSSLIFHMAERDYELDSASFLGCY